MPDSSTQYDELIKQAHAHGVGLQRSLIIWLGLAGLILLVTAAALSGSSRAIDEIGRQILIGGALVYGSCSALSCVVKDEHLFSVVRIWIFSAMAIMVALIANALFGPNNEAALSAHSQPFFIVIMPVIVFCHTYLPRRDANVMSGIFSLIIAALLVSFMVVYEDQMSDPANVTFMVVCILVLMPVTMGMLNLLQRSQEMASQRLHELLEKSSHDERLKQRAAQSDPETQFLKTAALLEMLQDLTADAPDAYFQTLSLEPASASDLDSCKADQRELLLNRIARKLRQHLEGDALLARTGDWRFFAVARAPGVTWPSHAIEALHCNLQELQHPGGGLLQWHVGSAIADHQSDGAFALEDADFQRYLAETRDRAWLVSPVLQTEMDQAQADQAG